MNENDVIGYEEYDRMGYEEDESRIEVKVLLSEPGSAKKDLLDFGISYSTSNTGEYLSKTEALEELMKSIKQIIDGENK